MGGVFELETGDVAMSQKQVRDNIIKKNQNQPVGVACSGCIFKNYEGIINPDLITKYPEIANFIEKGIIPSGYLIEKAGLKGLVSGGIQISERHANYMINIGHGKFNEVLDLIKIVKDKVFQEFGVMIEEEVVYLHTQMKKI